MQKRKSHILNRSLPTLVEYCLISQQKAETLLFFRQKPGLWAETEVTGLENEVHFQSIDVRLSMKQIYRRVEVETA